MGKNIKVNIRIRPISEGDEIWSTENGIIYSKDKTRLTSFSGFKSIFNHINNQDIYIECMKNEVKKFLNFENCTIFAYGQTGSGKTYTMLGDAEEGIIKLALKDILEKTDVSVSYLEIYNEKLYDLYNNTEVQIFNIGNKNYVSNLHSEIIQNWDTAISFIEKCEKNRRFGSTEFNTKSSRSHTVFQVTHKVDNKVSTLNMIDLAGSERASRSADRRREGSYINKSLLALCTVVNNISQGRYTGFRDSKLTRVLQPSMDGNTNLIAICMLSPFKECTEESISTLKFAARLSNLKLKTTHSTVEVPKTPIKTMNQELIPCCCKCGGKSSETEDVKQDSSSIASNDKKYLEERMNYSIKTTKNNKIVFINEAKQKEADVNINYTDGQSHEESIISGKPEVESTRKVNFDEITISVENEEKNYINLNCEKQYDKKIKILENLNKIYEERANLLEKMLTEILAKHPSKKFSEIFILEKHMFNIKKGIIEKGEME